MCGIWALLGKIIPINIREYYNKVSDRGPDSNNITYHKEVVLGFHRLAIIDLSDLGNQPFKHPYTDIHLICNGEIFNYEHLRDSLNFTTFSDSDCEVILYLYNLYGIDLTLKSLDGEFAFLLYDEKRNKIIAARDPFGIRPLFIGKNTETNSIIFSSEMKGIPDNYKIEHVKPGHYYEIDMDTKVLSKKQYYLYNYYSFPSSYNRQIEYNINKLLKSAVNKRLMSDREVGCLLSGGLDSSLIAGIAAKKLGKKLHTFSIGMPDSPDIKFAREVADYIGSTHHEVVLDKDIFLKAIDEVIYTIESFDITTVRASVGHYLVSKYVRENTNVKVLLGGEGADELCGGYIYFQKAPSPEEFNNECLKLLKQIHIFDVLRSDRCISKWGLESRVPFLDKEFVSFYMSIDPKLKSDGHKNLLRNSFASSSEKIIPDSILKRKKEAFSDGVSSVENSWHKIIKEWVEPKIKDEDLNKSYTKEGQYYFKTFTDFFGIENIDIIPHYWLPNQEWVGKKIDPSARDLDIYIQ